MRVKLIRYRKTSRCVRCGVCEEIVSCPGNWVECVGCGSCYLMCPHEAIEPYEVEVDVEPVRISVDGETLEVPSGITVLRALELSGWSVLKFPALRTPDAGKKRVFVPCETGGCFACAMVIDGELQPTCHTPVEDGMRIETDVEGKTPLRRVEGFSPHTVGGVGTPWWVKSDGWRYVEVACFVAGCNLRCPQCQNWFVTYNSMAPTYTPREAAKMLTAYRRRYGVHRMAISGGEPTVNRRWLVEFFKELRRLNTDRKARFHLDTNTTLLTEDYIDELVEDARITDIGCDLKGLTVETFQKITGIRDRRLAQQYLDTSWRAVKYIIDNYYPDKLFLGIGIPYNPWFMSKEELWKIGERLASWCEDVQVVVLDYRPEWRARYLRWPEPEEMLEVKRLLNEAGLKTVIVQTKIGHFGP